MANEPPQAGRPLPESPANLAMQTVAVNGLWLMIPILAFNMVLGGALPGTYQPENFWRDIPPILAMLENISRVAVSGLPALMRLGWREPLQRLGWLFYGAGSLAYGLAWAALILLPEGGWSKSLAGFSAPAWLPAIWLAGIALIAKPYWRWVRPVFMLAGAIFVLSHVAHTALIFSRI